MQRTILTLLLLASPALAQTHSTTWDTTSLTTTQLEWLDEHVRVAEEEWAADAGYAQRATDVIAFRAGALTRLNRAMVDSGRPTWGQSIASIGTFVVALDENSEVESITVSADSPNKTVVWDTFSDDEKDVLTLIAVSAQNSWTLFQRVASAVIAHNQRLAGGLRRTGKAMSILSFTPYPGTVNGITNFTVTRDENGVLTEIVVEGD